MWHDPCGLSQVRCLRRPPLWLLAAVILVSTLDRGPQRVAGQGTSASGFATSAGGTPLGPILPLIFPPAAGPSAPAATQGGAAEVSVALDGDLDHGTQFPLDTGFPGVSPGAAGAPAAAAVEPRPLRGAAGEVDGDVWGDLAAGFDAESPLAAAAGWAAPQGAAAPAAMRSVLWRAGPGTEPAPAPGGASAVTAGGIRAQEGREAVTGRSSLLDVLADAGNGTLFETLVNMAGEGRTGR